MNHHQAEALAVAVRSVMAEILRRAERDPTYSWIDTKLSTIDGSELRYPGAVDLFGKDTVYAWIQGRAVEALAGHARWLAAHGEPDLAATCLRVARRVALALEDARHAAGGRLGFWLDRAGVPFVLAADGRPTPVILDPTQVAFSDLFHARGLAALAALDPAFAALADARARHVLDALRVGRFVSDQQAFDPGNRVGEVIGRRSFGPAMIAVGLCALQAERAVPGALAEGLALIEGILAAHANLDRRWPELPPDTLCEFIAADGSPWHEAGHVVTDPGHACELVGLALWLFTVAQRRGLADVGQQDRIAQLMPQLACILSQSFTLGFRTFGLCKTWSLSAGRPLNDSLPWWSVQETMRATALLVRLAPQLAVDHGAAQIMTTCTRVFLDHYRNPAVHGWAVQTLDAAGQPLRVIPATPDADPGYHTGLCLIAVLDALG